MSSSRCRVYPRFFLSPGILIKGEITRAIASDPFYLAPRGRNRTPPSSSCPSMYRELTSRRDTLSTLSHLGLTVLVMDNRATRAHLLPSRARSPRACNISRLIYFLERRTSTVNASRRSDVALRQRGRKFLKFSFFQAFPGTRFTRHTVDIHIISWFRSISIFRILIFKIRGTTLYYLKLCKAVKNICYRQFFLNKIA